MIIKSHIRGGFRSAADYLKSQGHNEKIRTVDITDPDAGNMDEAFKNMWAVANNSRSKKPLHHISINPFKNERLTDDQVLKIVERCEKKYGYVRDEHQRVIVEHIKDGRQHFHVMWNRVSLRTGKAHWPGHHWNKSKQAAREMEKELGLQRVIPRRMKRALAAAIAGNRLPRVGGRYDKLLPGGKEPLHPPEVTDFTPVHAKSGRKSRKQGRKKQKSIPVRFHASAARTFYPAMLKMMKRRNTRDENIPDSEKMPFKRPEWDRAEIIAWALENGRIDILAQYGIDIPTEFEF